MAEPKKINTSTIVVVLGILATAGWLGFTLWDTWSTGHISSGQICLVHVGQTDRPLATVCVMAEARAPTQSGAVQVILSREHLIEFSKDIDKQTHSEPKDKSSFGTYELRDSIHPRRNERAISKESVRNVIEDLIGLTDSPSRATEVKQLMDVLKELATTRSPDSAGLAGSPAWA